MQGPTLLAGDDPYEAIGSTFRPKTVAKAGNQIEPGLDPDKPVKRAIPVVPAPDGRSKFDAHCRSGRSTNQARSRSCKTNRRRRWISVTTTEPARRRDFRLTVLNPGGRDPEQDFSSGINRPDDGGHAPVNFHGYAACTGGVFQREVQRAVAGRRAAVLLLAAERFQGDATGAPRAQATSIAGRRFAEGDGPPSDCAATQRPEARRAFSRDRASGGRLPGRDAGDAGLLWHGAVHPDALPVA